MPQAPASFSVKFDLTGTPKLVLTDTSGWTGLEKPDVHGYFEITLPDGIKRLLNLSSPDISYSGGDLTVFEYNLRLDTTQKPQCGAYIIRYVTDHPSYTPGEFIRTFDWTYKDVTLNLKESFNVFSPQLLYLDNTIYQRGNYNITSQTWNWSAQVGSVGIVTATTQNIDLAYLGSYYDAVYNISFSTTLLYTHQTYSWLTVLTTLTRTIQTTADTPCTPNQLIACLSSLKDRLDAAVNNCGNYSALKEKYIYAESLLSHLFHKLRIDDTAGAVDLIEEFETVANCSCPTNRNQVIPPYDIGTYTGQNSGWLVTNYFATATDAANGYFIIPALIGKVLKGIKASGTGRVFISQETTYTPGGPEDTYWFKSSLGKFTYNYPPIVEGTWYEIYYSNT